MKKRSREVAQQESQAQKREARAKRTEQKKLGTLAEEKTIELIVPDVREPTHEAGT